MRRADLKAFLLFIVACIAVLVLGFVVAVVPWPYQTVAIIVTMVIVSGSIMNGHPQMLEMMPFFSFSLVGYAIGMLAHSYPNVTKTLIASLR